MSTAANIRKRRSQSARFTNSRRFSYESVDRLKELERGFLLDGVALSHLANNEIGRSKPSLNIGIPQYHALQDPANQSYLKRKGLPKAIKQIAENPELSESMMGKKFDRFVRHSEAIDYLNEAKKVGAGYTPRIYGGHLSLPTAPAMDGYNGPDGYRRNTPELREKPSSFDFNDPFDNPKPVNRRLRTQSAPATIQLMRLKSASVYRSHPAGRRIFSAFPQPPGTNLTLPQLEPRPLATGPV